MSDHFIVIVPRDPSLVPTDEQQQQRVVGVLNRIAPTAESVTAEAWPDVRFFDCGQNFKGLSCPRCESEISVEWWQDRMDDDTDGDGFRLSAYEAPCCEAPVNLNELIYDWPQAFGRFCWTVQNANIGELNEAAKAELEVVAGFALVPIHQHV
jgi:hypothetical protein